MRRNGHRVQARRPAPPARRWPWQWRWSARAGLTGLLAAAAVAGYHWAPPALAGLMTVRHVSIAGTARLERREILELLALSGDSSLLWLDRARLERRVETHPWVASASVGRVLPHTLSVIVAERKPAAWARDGDAGVLVDEEGVALTPSPSSPPSSSTGLLPTFVGLSPAKLLAGDRATRERVRKGLDFAEGLRRRFGRVESVDFTGAGFLSGRAGARVVLATDDFREAWRRYLDLESALLDGPLPIPIQNPQEIDLRFVGKLIVRQKG